MVKQKGSALIFILTGVLVIVAIGGAYYFGKSQTQKPQNQPQNPIVTPQTPQAATVPTPSTTPDETANWKVYISTLGFSIEYPKELFLQEYPGSKGGVVFTRKKEFLDYENHIDMEILWRDALVADKGIDALNRPLQDLTINGYPAKKISDDPIYEESVWIYNRDRTKVMRVIITTAYDQDPYKTSSFYIYQKMLSTFKFTNNFRGI